MSCLLPRLDLWNLPTEKTEDEKRERRKKNNRRRGKEGEGRGKKCSKVLACISLSLSIFIYIFLCFSYFFPLPQVHAVFPFFYSIPFSLLNIGCFKRYFENIGHYGRYLTDIMRYALIRTATDITLRYRYSSDRYRYVSADNPNPLIDSLQFQVVHIPLFKIPLMGRQKYYSLVI